MDKPHASPHRDGGSRRNLRQHLQDSARADASYRDPLEYQHAYPSLERYAQWLALRHDPVRTRHAYFRQLRLITEHFDQDPALLSESQLRDYLLHVKTIKGWKPKTLRQALACAKGFFVEMLGREEWKVFGQVRAKDHDSLPVVLTRQQVRDLLAHVRLRRYRIPLKLIYCCGLRLSECLSLTIHDVLGTENRLRINRGKGNHDRLIPLPEPMLEDLRHYWEFHRHPLLLFPAVGQGSRLDPKAVAARMHRAKRPMPGGSLQRLVVVARRELNLPDASVHSLRHSFATHLLEAGAHLSTIQKLLGHRMITSTMVYLHLTHTTQKETLRLMEQLCRDLPR